MDRRSWLWRSKSSDKSPGETESSGSISSHSERFSDDQVFPTHSSQSPEVTSKAAPTDEEFNEHVKTLSEKLSAALLNISAKENLVKQHAKVAEEAVSGWEKAENEVLALKQQLEATTHKNSALEDQVGHLDEALKECLRQLRQAKEEQEKKIHEAVAKKSHEWETTKSEFENQLVGLQTQLQTAKTKAAAPIDHDLRPKLEAVEKENSELKFELLSRADELQLRIIERDLSTQAAETASKQHLESIKKVAKLEAECRRLKAFARKASPANDQSSLTASSVYVESIIDNQSDSGERLLAAEIDAPKCDSWASTPVTELDRFKNVETLGRNFMIPSFEINLMDDFLEMERLAALPDTESGSCCNEVGPVSDPPNCGENPLKAELEATIHRTAELEEKLEKMEAEKVELEMILIERQMHLEKSQGRLKEAEAELMELQKHLVLASESKKAAEEEVKANSAGREAAESRVRVVEAEIKSLIPKVDSLEHEVAKERALSAENIAKCQKLEDELSRMKHEAELHRQVELQDAANSTGELKINQEKELAVAANHLAECQKTMASLAQQLKSLATLEDFLIDSEKPLENSVEELQCPNNGEEPWKLYCSPKTECEPLKIVSDGSDRDSSLSLNPAIERSQIGFGKLFPVVRTTFKKNQQTINNVEVKELTN